MKAAADNLIPVTMELGGKSPNIYFSSIADEVSECVCIPLGCFCGIALAALSPFTVALFLCFFVAELVWSTRSRH